MLKKGDKVGIVSPSSYIEQKDFQKGMDYLTSLGFECVLGENIFRKNFWMAGTPEERAFDINSFFANPEIKAIFTTRGGAGSQKILDYIDYETIKKNPKPFFGFSDTTSLQLAIYSQTKSVSYSGFLLMFDFIYEKIDGIVEKSLLEIFSGAQKNIKAGETFHNGKAEGVLVGGTLALLNGLTGTKYFPLKEDSILLIEDTEERTYRIDLFLDQLRKNENFHNVKGIIIGEFVDCENSMQRDISIDDIINNFCRGLNIPIIKNFPYGHGPSRHIMPIGRKVLIDADSCELSFL
ncbi:MAG: LD-carboxypeptidase [Lactobacillaceae bacterium]|jgi:muramoyltetrapeptide carboxypeptidase|nr:LD-carboxypeptidase [Lactobacillaceae bacterium]